MGNAFDATIKLDKFYKVVRPEVFKRFFRIDGALLYSAMISMYGLAENIMFETKLEGCDRCRDGIHPYQIFGDELQGFAEQIQRLPPHDEHFKKGIKDIKEARDKLIDEANRKGFSPDEFPEPIKIAFSWIEHLEKI